MGQWRISRQLFGHRFTPVLALLSFATAYAGHVLSVRAAAAKTAGSGVSIPGMASLSGTVDAPKAFKAARVYIRNVDKRILYMVYTNGGVFRAVALFPGKYEVNVRANGLESEVQTIVLKAEDRPALKLSMRESANPEQLPSAVQDRRLGITVQSYDEVYPPGPGREVLEKVCMNCHGENFLPTRPAVEEVWQERLDYMMGKNLYERDKIGDGEGALAPAATGYRFGLQDRKDALAYLSKNFGPDSIRRTVRTVPEIPLDEAKLGSAEFIEYYLTPDSQAQGSEFNSAQASETVVGLNKRVGFTMALDAKGNVWLTDRGFPNRLVKLDPRTGEQKDYPLPDPKGGIHDLVIDREGLIWITNNGPTPATKEPLVNVFNPETEVWKQLDPDPNNTFRTSVKHGAIGTEIDSKGNVYMAWSIVGSIVKYDRETSKFSIFRIPTPNSVPYGLAVDKNDNMWSANWSSGKLIKFDTTTQEFTEFTPPTYPANLRRGPTADSRNNIWFGIWAAGERPGKLAELDQATGRITEWTIPHRGASPYEATADREDNIWFPEEGTTDRPSAIGRFDPRDKTFTFYPKPQSVADSPKLVHTQHGAVWYSPRGTISPGFGVLYPDMDKIKTLAAYPLNGPPGLAFKMASAPRKEGSAGQ